MAASTRMVLRTRSKRQSSASSSMSSVSSDSGGGGGGGAVVAAAVVVQQEPRKRRAGTNRFLEIMKQQREAVFGKEGVAGTSSSSSASSSVVGATADIGEENGDDVGNGGDGGGEVEEKKKRSTTPRKESAGPPPPKKKRRVVVKGDGAALATDAGAADVVTTTTTAPAPSARGKSKALMNKQAMINSKMAKKRLAFLLRQSDVFAHFVAGNSKKGKIAKTLSPHHHKNPETNNGSARLAHAPGENEDGDDEADLMLRDALFRSDDEETEDEKEMTDQNPVDGSSTYVSITTTPPFIKNGEMRDYQLEGLTWLVNLQANGMGGILADEMGLGKTLQSIALLGYMKHCLGVSGPHIVIGPKSTISNWLTEFEKWCPSLRALKLQGNQEERAETIAQHLVPGREEESRTFDVLVTSYEISIIERATIAKFPWVYLILDEAHRVKNEESKLAEVLRTFSVQHRLLLTGTPLQNNLHELWALLNFLLPEIFSSSEHFDEWFDLGSGDDDAKHDVVTKLHRMLQPFMLRRLKKDVAKALPPKTETLLFVGLSEMQREIYRRILERDMDALLNSFKEAAREEVEVLGSTRSQSIGLPKKKETKRDTVRLLNIVMQLKKTTNHPYLFEGVEDRSLPPLGEHLIQNCGKLMLLDKLLPKLKRQGSRCLIFSQMTRLLDILEDYCHIREYSYCRLDGATSYEDREQSISSFNAPNSEVFLFLLSTRAGGLGINLATADTVIIYDSDWNPQVDLQAQDRAHRIGQTRPVHVYRLVSEGTVEEKIVERAETKLKLDAVVIQQGRLLEQQKKAPTKEEMMAMIRYGAEQMFRCKDGTVTDDDIEAIIARGEQRTADLNSKLESVHRSNSGVLDFKLDSSISGMQQFDGVDYKEAAAQAASMAASSQKSSNALKAIEFLKSIAEEARSSQRRARNKNGTNGPDYGAIFGNGTTSVDFYTFDERAESWEDPQKHALEVAERANVAAQGVIQAIEHAMSREVPIPRRLQVNKFQTHQLYPEEEILAINRKERARYARWAREKWLAEIEVKIQHGGTSDRRRDANAGKTTPVLGEGAQPAGQEKEGAQEPPRESEPVQQGKMNYQRQRKLEDAQTVRAAALKEFMERAPGHRAKLAENDEENTKLGWKLPPLGVPGYGDDPTPEPSTGSASNEAPASDDCVDEAGVVTSNTKFFSWAPSIPSLLSKEEEAEKRRLWSLGFPTWERSEFRSLLRALGRFGPTNYEAMHRELKKTKTLEEVTAYAKAFVERGRASLGEEEWKKLAVLIDSGIERAKDLDDRLSSILRKLDTVQDPQNDLKFFRSTYSTSFTLDEDRFLLLCLRELGWGRWRDMLEKIRSSERYQFDYFFLGLKEEDISRRCESLSKMMKRDEKMMQKNLEKEKQAEEARVKKEKEDAEREKEIKALLDAKQAEISARLSKIEEEEREFLERLQKAASTKPATSSNNENEEEGEEGEEEEDDDDFE